MKSKLLKKLLRTSVRKGCLVFVVGLVSCLVGSSGCLSRKAPKVLLSENGRALHAIVVSNGASKRTHEVAKELSKYLGRITGGDFEIKEGDGTRGIALGNYKDFPKLELEDIFDPEDLTRRDEYLIRTHRNGVYLIGATDIAAQHAAWDLLYRLGYRQFFPTETWEIVPEKPDLSINLDAFEKPDFYNRNAPEGPSGSDDKLWLRWQDRNRMTSFLILNSFHSYNGIIDRNKEAFDQNPEFLALVGGKRGGGLGDKFCISNKDLRRLVVKDAERRIEDNPDANSISMEPSDGGDWCECEACKEMGSISDRVVILANEVAEAINKMGYGQKYVGIYAYNLHSPPPDIDVNPNVIVSIATSFIRGGYTLKELIEGWSERTKMLGIRDYHDVFKWSQALPRKALGGNVKYLKENIPYFHEKGAWFIESEGSDSWGANGLGFYLSAHLLWDLDAVEKVEELINDFLDKSFGEAREPMGRFYHMIAEDYDTQRTEEDLLANMYGYLKEARELTEDLKVLARLDELALYTRYVELWFRFASADRGEEAREKAAQEVYQHAYRMQNTMMVYIEALYRYLRQRGVNIPNEVYPGPLSVGRTLKDEKPWKSSEPFTNKEITQIIEDGVASYKKDEMEFELISFSEDLEPAAEKLNLRKVSTGDMGGGSHKLFTWFRPDNKQLTLEVTGGLIKNYRNRGNVQFKLYSPQEATLDPVDIDKSVPPDGEKYKIVLESPYEGLHKLDWSDGGDQTHLEWIEGTPMTVRSSMDDPARLGNNFRLYFYVPKGTKTVGGYTTQKDIQINDSEGNKVLDLNNVDGSAGYFNISVPVGQDGTLWELKCAKGTVSLMTVPPYLARNEKELLLPKEVVKADKSN
jgi:hypothetical protein